MLLRGGTRIAYEEHGPTGAPPVVLLHGLGEGTASWAAVVPRLAERHRVLARSTCAGASDWPGRTPSRACGTTWSGCSTRSRPEELADVVLAWLGQP